MKKQSHAFTLAELLVGITIIAILAALLLPVVSRIRDQGRTTQCLSQMRQIGIAARAYANDNDQTLPLSAHQRASWVKTLQPYASGKIAFRCPCDTNTERQYSYALNDFLLPPSRTETDPGYSLITRIASQRTMLFFAEISPSYTGADHLHFGEYRDLKIPPEVFEQQVDVRRHNTDRANYLFVDAHVETLTWLEVQRLIAGTDGVSMNIDGDSQEAGSHSGNSSQEAGSHSGNGSQEVGNHSGNGSETNDPNQL